MRFAVKSERVYLAPILKYPEFKIHMDGSTIVGLRLLTGLKSSTKRTTWLFQGLKSGLVKQTIGMSNGLGLN
jgi:hypothetical protein